jgi:AraC family transcriptional regulator
VAAARLTAIAGGAQAEAMSLTNRALWVIDRNLGADLTLAGIAGACGVSRHHLAHAFGQASGMTVMEYVRRRRLSEAARALAEGAGDILELALASGYRSHEAFTRAFRGVFATTPDALRRRGSTLGLALTAPLQLPERSRAGLATPVIVAGGAVLAVGLRERRSFADMAVLPAQWRRFGPEIASIGDKASPVPLAILGEADNDGGFDYTCAVEVRSFAAAPAGLARIRIRAQTYAVFQHAGHVSRIGETYATILEDWLPGAGRTLAGGPSLERHAMSFDPRTGEGGLTIWLPLADDVGSVWDDASP